jgi:outer membrane protein assembly factor BamB
VWSRDLGRAVEYSPIPVEDGWLIAVTGNAVLRVNAETGEEIWKHKLGSAPAAPAVCAGVAVVACDYPEYKIVGVSLETGKEMWKLDRVRGTVTGTGDRLFLVTRGGAVRRLDPATGDETWEAALEGAGWSDPVHWPGADLLLVPVRPDSLVALHADSGERVWSRPVGTSPRVAAGELGAAVANAEGGLLLLDGLGTVTARAALAGRAAGPPAMQGDRIVVALDSGEVRAYRGSRLEVLWSRRLGAPLVAAPVTGGGLVAQSAPRGGVHFMRLVDGDVTATAWHEETLITGPAYGRAGWIVAGRDGTVALFRGAAP